MESKKINQLATELAPVLSDLTIIGDPTTGISKKITLSQMASLFTGTVEEYPNLASFPLVGTADTIYIALDTNVLYRWNTGTNAYVELSPNIINSLVFSDANGFDGTISLVGSTATLTITTALTTGSVAFIGASGALTQDNSNFYWDNTNKRLGINTNAPTTAIDTFGSGIITRVNGTSTNNAFIGFASAGTNKWSVGNVQSDHRFRIYNEATTSELVSVLQTGEFGIGIANPTTKLHIDGGASALIANLDANVSVAKSVSFRSDNSNRINLEVSGTESGSNAGANFFLRTYTDAGSLLETPFSIVRSTGVTTLKSLTLTNALSIANGGTGSTTQNFVDLTTAQTVGGAKIFTSTVQFGATSGYTTVSEGQFFSKGGNNIFIGNLLAAAATLKAFVIQRNDVERFSIGLNSSDSLAFINASGTSVANISSTGAATFLSINTNAYSYLYGLRISGNDTGNTIYAGNASMGITAESGNTIFIGQSNLTSGFRVFTSTGAATFSSSIQATNIGIGFAAQSDIGAFVYQNSTNVALGVQQDGSGIPFRVTSGGVQRFYVNNNGSIQIGATVGYTTIVPGQFFTKGGGSMFVSNALSGGAAKHYTLQRNDSTIFHIGGDGSDNLAFINASDSYVGYINKSTGAYVATSDKVLKTNISNSGNALNIISKIKIRSYDWLVDGKHEPFGVIAQELYEIAPTYVYKPVDETSNWGVSKAELVPMLIKSIQELNNKFESLKN
jgi:hypothetical protein